MDRYRIAEIFSSINGEGVLAGQLAVFIRFCGCNLRCSFCDTTWANEPDCPRRILDTDQIIREISASGIRLVTITGGEPLIQDGIGELFEAITHAEINLSERGDSESGGICQEGPGENDLSRINSRKQQESSSFHVEVETNGSVALLPFMEAYPAVTFTMDYKLPGSGMEQYMCMENLSVLRPTDTIKFVAGSQEDLNRALELIRTYDLTEHCHVYLSPVFGKIEPADMVEFMKEHRMNGVNLQLQMHKFIWDSEARGV